MCPWNGKRDLGQSYRMTSQRWRGLCEPTEVPEGGRERGLRAISMGQTSQAFQAPAEPLCASARKRPASSLLQGLCSGSPRAGDRGPHGGCLGQVRGGPVGGLGPGSLLPRQKALLPSLTSVLTDEILFEQRVFLRSNAEESQKHVTVRVWILLSSSGLMRYKPPIVRHGL